MKTFLKNVLYIFPILICVAFLATVDRIVKVERETLLAKQYATTVEDIDEIDKIVRFADKKVDKDTNFMFWVDQLIGAATCDEVIAVVLDDELKPLGRRHR
jgi:hypothetical protein